MSHVFDLSAQQDDVDSKIVAGLERIGRALYLELFERAREHGLSPIQAQILIYLKHPRGKDRRVGAVARAFGLTHATVSDAVTSLQQKGLVTRRQSAQDRRAFLLELTDSGKEAAAQLEGWADAVKDLLAWSDGKAEALRFITEMIAALQAAGIISVARTCRTCRYFQPGRRGTGGPHHCTLLDKPLSETDVRVDCPDYEPLAEAGSIGTS